MDNSNNQLGLDQYIDMFEEIYEPIQNIERDFNHVLARLLEAIAGCSQYVNKYDQKGLADNLPNVFSWYCSLVYKSGISSPLSEALWRKFPAVCPYCLKSPCACTHGKKSLANNSHILEDLSKNNITEKPVSLYEWQIMFSKIYPRSAEGFDQKINFAHLIEELGEASEAYRIRYYVPTALESELADIFTWIIGMANFVNSQAIEGNVMGYTQYNFEKQVYDRYPHKCPDCKHIPCSCISNQSRQKISELNVVYPDQIVETIEKSTIQINDNIMNLMKSSEAQDLMIEIRKLIDGSEITEMRVKELIEKLILQPSHKKWYENITASGLAESGIVSIATLLLQNTFI